MKTAIRYLLHKFLGFSNYLFAFSLFKIYTLRFDKKEKDFFCFLNLIPEDSIVLDVGANIGIMTVHLAKKIKNVEVFSFEPIPENIMTLKRVVSFLKLSNIKIFEMALGNEEGEVAMVMPVIKGLKMQGLSHVIHKSISENNEGEKFITVIKKIDNIEELKKETSKKIGGIKIDVENFEYFVLEGTKELLKQHNPVIYIELWENENRDKCFELIKKFDYQINIVDQGKLKEYDKQIHHTQNFIFLPLMRIKG